MTITGFLNSTKKVNWEMRDKQVFHNEYGRMPIETIIKNPNHVLLSIIPLLKDNALIIFTVREEDKSCLCMKDIRYDNKTNRLTSSSDFKFFIGKRKLKRLKDEIKSCCRKEGTIGIGFFLRRISALGINNIATEEFIK